MTKDKRSLVIAAVLLVLAAGTIFIATRMNWVSTRVEDLKQPARDLDIDGGTWAPALTGVAIVLLAAVAAAVALKGTARRVVAVIAAIAGVAAAFPAVGVLTGDPDLAYAQSLLELQAGAWIATIETASTGPVLVCVGALLSVIAAVLLIRGAGSGGMGSGYVTPAARRDQLERTVFAARQEPGDGGAAGGGAAGGGAPGGEREQARPVGPEVDESRAERDLWDALDTGADPTDPRPDTPRNGV